MDVASQCMEHTGVDCDQPRYACDASTDSHCVELSLQFVISKLIKDCFDKQCRRIDDLSILKWMSDTSHQSYERQNVETDIGDAFSKIKDGLMLAVQAVKCNRQVGNLGEELSLGNLPNLWYKKVIYSMRISDLTQPFVYTEQRTFKQNVLGSLQAAAPTLLGKRPQERTHARKPTNQ